MATTTTTSNMIPARVARYERLGSWLPRDQENLGRLRDHHAMWKRLAREGAAIRARRAELERRREMRYTARAVAIQERLIAEGKIRPPSRDAGDEARFRRQVAARMRNDPAAIALGVRWDRGTLLLRAIADRRRRKEAAAGVLPGDDRAMRHAKRWERFGPREGDDA